MSLSKKRIQLLVDALRSNEYKQVRGSLGTSDGYCCLGVACEVAIANGVDISKKLEDGDDGREFYSYDDATGTMPDDAADWFGFHGRDPEFYLAAGDMTRLSTTATGLNDSSMLSFSQIADMFEYFYLNYKEEKGK